MSPRANRDQDTAPVRYPRTISEHMHSEVPYSYPPRTGSAEVIQTFALIPDNWNGLDALVLWVLGGFTGAFALDITIDIGTCNELFSAHTQTVNAIAINMVINEWECLDLTVTFATVLANLAARDKLRIRVVSNDEQDIFPIEIELQET